jgi:hypothetical protein
MIEPEEIRRKALNLYPAYQLAWLDGEPFFPKEIRCDKSLDGKLASAIESVQRLRSSSKEQLGFGYTIEWEERNSRTHGRNRFPQKILFETPQDFLRFIGKEREFALFAHAVERLRGRYPQLETWIRSHRKDLIEAAAEIDGLLQVLDYFVAHPRPGLFARELPLPVDTKFIENNRRTLRAWLDLILPPHTIRADEEHFDRRFGLRYAEPVIFIRFLDEVIRQGAASPWSECGIPLHTLATHTIHADRVLIVENKVNLLTLPSIGRTLALGGLGNSITDLRYVPWLGEIDVWYWGDIDVDGFEILSRLRRFLPHTRSLLMDVETIQKCRTQIGSVGNGRAGEPPPQLTQAELRACRLCFQENLRIEQERIPQALVIEEMKGVFNAFS